MPSKSKQQQKFFGVVKAMQKGDIPKKGEAGEVADDMTKKEVDKMASTKHKGLVNKIKELVEEEIKALIEAKLPDEGFSDPEQMREAHKLVKVLGGYPVTYEGDPNNYRAIISEPMNDRQKEDMIKKAKQAGYIAKPNMGGGVTIFVKENKITEADRTSSISKQRAKAELKQQLKGKRADGLGDYTAIVYGMNGSDRVPLKGMNDINKYSKFEIGDNEKALKEDNINEAKSAKALKADYEKAIKKEQALSSLMLMNLQKYKAAKASGDENAIAKFTKIAGQLSPKKKKASELASAAYQAYEDKISGLHADAELELKEGKLNEMDMNDPVLMAFRASKQAMPKSQSRSRKISFDKYLSLLDMQTDLQNDIKELADLMAQTLRDMEQEAEPGGGLVSDRYGSLMMKQEKEYKILRAKKAKVDTQIDKYQSL
jgi:hypothetical protein